MSELSPDNDFIIAHVLDPGYGEGAEFRSWPRHITLVPWFSLSSTRDLHEKLERVERLPISVRVGDWAKFGSDEDIDVQRIVDNIGLLRLHETLLTAVEAEGELASYQHVRGDYHPHITKQNAQVFEAGSRLIVDDFCLIERNIDSRSDQEHSLKTVIGRYLLRG